MICEDRVLGVFALYSGRCGGFAAETQTAVRVAAGHVGVLYRTALGGARTREVAAQLKQALSTRATIDQALGIVMARRRCTARDAFAFLRRVSQDSNVKLHQVAASIVEAVSGCPAPPAHFDEPVPSSDRE
ncbi:ANTAR domain-containing protein [Nonomuraea sp. NN258]|nr:ANTAR domain-containing protein [Nonomuraea antri]